MLRFYCTVTMVVCAVWGSVANRAQAVPYAVAVVDSFHPFPAHAQDPQDLLGPRDNVNYAMGNSSGWVNLLMGQPIVDIPGFDFLVWPEGPITGHDENADVYLSFDALNWILVSQIRRIGDVGGDGRIDIAGKGVSGAMYVRLEQVGSGAVDIPTGTDIDAVTIVEPLTTSAIPEPATATLGLLALGGLMMRRRRMV